MNLGISTKLFLLCLLVSLALLAMAGYAARSLTDVAGNADRTERVRVPQAAAMSQMELAISRVCDIVGEISQASQEQNTSVVQIGQAVTEMDQTTQQNAALVEQSAAAASALKEQADHLVASVGTFRV